MVKHLDFQNNFPNGNLDRSVYAELSKHLFSEEGQRKFLVMKLQRCYMDSKALQKYGSSLIKCLLEDTEMNEIQRAPGMFQGNGIIVVCSVDDLLVFAGPDDKIDNLEKRSSGDLIVKDLGIPRSSLGIKLGWLTNGFSVPEGEGVDQEAIGRQQNGRV